MRVSLKAVCFQYVIEGGYFTGETFIKRRTFGRQSLALIKTGTCAYQKVRRAVAMGNYQHDIESEKQQLQKESEVISKCLARNSKQCSFFYHDNMTIVYKAFTTLCLICGITKEENELAIQELLNVFMESLVLYFGQVSELDMIERVLIFGLVLKEVFFRCLIRYMILDEVILNGCVGFTSKERALLPLQLLDAGS